MKTSIHHLSAQAILASVLFTLAPGQTLFAETSLPTNISASSAIVIDRDTGLVLGAKAPDTRRAMAGTTKIMTALIATEQNRTGMANVVTVSAAAANVGGASMGLAAGDQLSLRDLLHGMLLSSGNDAALAIAEHVSGSEAAFVTTMNTRAVQLGLINTQFRNAHGRDPVDIPGQCVAPFNTQPNCGHYSSALDLAALARFALKEPVLARIVETTNHLTTTWVNALSVAKNKVLTNANPLLASPRYPGASGVRDGITGNAGQCLVASAGVSGKQIIAVLLRSSAPDAEGRQLLDFGSAQLFERLHPTSMAHGFFNNDAYEDLAVGIPYAEVAGVPAAGKVVVYYGTATGLDTNNPVCFSQESPAVPSGAEWGDYFGFALAAGDFDGNGRDDLAIGVPFENGYGAVHVFYSDNNGLNPGFREHYFAQDNLGDGDLPGTAEAGDLFGFSLAVGDFDGNGRDDLAIGVPGEDTETVVADDGGAVNVIYGSATGLDATLHPQIFDQSNPAAVPGTAEEGDRFGFALAAGDFDGNGYDDLAVGAPFEVYNGNAAAGHVSLLFSRAGGLDPAFNVGELHQDVPGVPSTAEPQDLFGYALAVGDFDGNGYDDLAIGAPGETVFAVAGAGVVNVVYNDGTGLNAAWAARPAQEFHQDSANMPDTSEAGDRFGAALAVGDFDNSRLGTIRDDLAIGIPGEDLEGTPTLVDVGAVTVIYSSGTNGLVAGTNTDLLVPQNPVGVTSAAGPGEQFGTVLAAGRFDSGSTEDLAWGAYGRRFDGVTLRTGATLATYSTGANGVSNGAEKAFDAWLGDCCDAGLLPLHITVTNSVRKIWNIQRGDQKFWNYEGRDYDYPASDSLPDGYALDLDRALCTEHFRIYYANEGDEAVTRNYAAAMARLLEEGWEALVLVHGFRDPAELQADGRYSIFQNFRRVPVLISNLPRSANGTASEAPAIALDTSLEFDNETPVHELFHVVLHGYTFYGTEWLNEGLARWSQQLKPGANFPCGSGFMPLSHNFLLRDYCATAPWFQYLGLKYTANGGGADVIRAMLEEMGEAHVRRTVMLAFERALNRFASLRDSESGTAFAEWAAGNYVNDTEYPAPMRSDAPLYPRYKEGGRVGAGGNEYLFREYTFALARSDSVTIQVRASANDPDGAGPSDDDDLRLLLDGVALGDWNSTNAFDGGTLLGQFKTLHLVKPNLAAGTHTLRLEGDEHPVLYSLTVFEGEVPLLLQSSPDFRPANPLNGTPFLTNSFVAATNTTNFTILLTGVAQTNDHDSALLYLDGTSLAVRANEDLNGNALEGDLATVEIHVAARASNSHTLIIRGYGQPLIRDLVVFPTPEQPPLLQVRTGKLLPWSASYHVVPVTQALLDSGDAVQFDFNTIQWGDEVTPPFTELIKIGGNVKVGPSFRQRVFSTMRGHSADTMAMLGGGSRLVHVTTAAEIDGTYELMVTRVPDANNAPVLAFIPDRIALEGQTLRFTASASDPDVPANRLTYTLALGAPAGAAIDSRTGEFTFTPSETQGGGVYDITVRVVDDGNPSLADTDSFRVTVAEVNEPPRVNPIADRSVREGEAVSLGVTANDPDRPLNVISYSLDPGAPGGMTIDHNTGWLRWEPNEAQGPGSYTIIVRATDNGTPSRSGSNVFTVTVAEVNQAPSLAAIADRTLHAGMTLAFPAYARDYDIPANTLRYSLAGAPAEARLNADTGLFTWTPGDAEAGFSYDLTVQVVDDGSPSLSDSDTFTVTVVSRPEITSIALVDGRIQLTWTAVAGQRYRLQYSASLGQDNWIDLPGEVLAVGESATTDDIIGPATQCFYRVQVLP